MVKLKEVCRTRIYEHSEPRRPRGQEEESRDVNGVKVALQEDREKCVITSHIPTLILLSNGIVHLQ